VTYCRAGDVECWTRTIRDLLHERATCPSRWRARQAAGRLRARPFSWRRFGDEVVRVYEQIAGARV